MVITFLVGLLVGLTVMLLRLDNCLIAVKHMLGLSSRASTRELLRTLQERLETLARLEPPSGLLYSYVCRDCGEFIGGGIERGEQKAPLPTAPCVWCGKGPVVVEYCDDEKP